MIFSFHYLKIDTKKLVTVMYELYPNNGHFKKISYSGMTMSICWKPVFSVKKEVEVKEQKFIGVRRRL
ncbi:hypothetical protein CJ483_13270 [Bacillus sp. PK3_68]|nr:hypothetical protein CJ483_13270 [Bacillus sp. PK3_68]